MHLKNILDIFDQKTIHLSSILQDLRRVVEVGSYSIEKLIDSKKAGTRHVGIVYESSDFINNPNVVATLVHDAKFSKDVKVYVDSDLGNGIKGEELARDINQKGFSEIYICTGYHSSDFAPMPWVRGVVGKLPPFV